MQGIKRIVLAAAAVLALCPVTATAASLGVDITSNGPQGGAFISPVFTIGLAVDVTTPIRVTALGVWDEGSNGLRESHPVGLWTGAGTLLASSTIPAGAGADAAVGSALGLGRWLFEDIAPLTLAPGHYVMGSVSGIDEFRSLQGSIALNPALANFDSSKFAAGSSLQFPDQDEGFSAFSLFGPNLLLEPVAAPVPLPAPLVLVALGFALLVLGTRLAASRAR